MGFRDPEAFNQALLAKQAWRILQVPTSLCARVLKARYFSEDSILTATCSSMASYTFRSILHGRDLLWERLIWRIGDGSQVRIHHANWIPRSNSMKPLGQVYMPGVTRVTHLLSHDGKSWNMGRLQAMFTPDDVHDIQQIAVGGPGRSDYLAWNYTKDGCFTVKSAYHMCMAKSRARSGQPDTSSSVTKHRGYMAL